MNTLAVLLVVVLVSLECQAKSLHKKRGNGRAARSTCTHDSSISGTVGVCFICDSKCMARLDSSTYSGDRDKFFTNLVEYLTAQFATFSSVTFFKQRVNYEAIDRGLELFRLETKPEAQGQEDSYIVNNWWNADRRNYYTGAPYFCDIAFLFTEYMSSMATGGAAFMSSVCTAYSSGFVIMDQDINSKFGLVAARFAHEVGHLFGMFHDHQQWQSTELEQLGPCNTDIGNSCPTGGGVMSSTATSGSTFSECSKKYFYRWQALAKDPAVTTVSHACILPPYNAGESGSGE